MNASTTEASENCGRKKESTGAPEDMDGATRAPAAKPSGRPATAASPAALAAMASAQRPLQQPDEKASTHCMRYRPWR